MPRYQKEMEDLSSTIEEIIDRAVSSQNYQKLNQTIRQAVNTAVDSGSEALRWAMDEAAKKSAVKNKSDVVEQRTEEPLQPPARETVHQHRWSTVHQQRRQPRPSREQPNVNAYSSKLGSQRSTHQGSQLPALYGSTSGRMTGGILKTVFGSVLSLIGFSGMTTAAVVDAVMALHFGAVGMVFAGMTLGGGWLLTSGIRTICKVNRFNKYVKALGQGTHCKLQRLAQAVGKSQKFVKKEIQGMIEEGLFLEGHVDEEENSLITSDDTFAHCQAVRQQQTRQKQAEAQKEQERREKAETGKLSAQVQEVLDKGNAYLRQIRLCNDAIPGEEISEKISRMETIVQKIFDRVKAHPEIVPDLKKLMDYYLPMTVKLLKAYADMDAQPVQGENIRSSKKEIEQTLDTLNNAFEKLLDSVFRDTAMDVSSDITVLQTLLAQEGLTDNDFDSLRKKL